MDKIWCGVCGKTISQEEYQKDLKNLKNTPNNACKVCRKEKKMKKQEIEGIKLHIIDGIRSLRFKTPDIKQAEHNFFEIANHLGLKDEQVCDNCEKNVQVFICFRCDIEFASKYVSKIDKKLCKYCEEFDDENGEMKKTT